MLTNVQRAGWGLADLGIVVFVMVKQLLVLDFLTNYLGVPVAIAGGLTTAILIVDIITDPIVGYFSDRTTSRFGRRAPWIALGALVMCAGIAGMFAAPPAEGANWFGAASWLGGFFILATIGFTMAAIPYAATAGEITQDPKERSKMLAWRMAFASLGILIGGGGLPLLAGGTREGHLSAVLMISPLIIGTIWLSLWITRKAPRIDQPSEISFGKMFSIVLSSRAFLVLVLSYGIMTLAVAQITAGMPFAAKYLISDGGNSPFSGAVAGGLPVLTLLFAPFVFGAMLSQPIWAILSIRFSKLGALVTGLCLYIVVLTALYTHLPSANLTAMVALIFFAGFANGAYQAIPWAMYPDLMDKSRAETGEPLEGAFSSMWLFGQKVANAFAPGILGLIIAASGWQETTQGTVEQTEAALGALRSAMTLVPIGIFVLALLVLIVAYKPLRQG